MTNTNDDEPPQRPKGLLQVRDFFSATTPASALLPLDWRSGISDLMVNRAMQSFFESLALATLLSWYRAGFSARAAEIKEGQTISEIDTRPQFLDPPTVDGAIRSSEAVNAFKVSARNAAIWDKLLSSFEDSLVPITEFLSETTNTKDWAYSPLHTSLYINGARISQALMFRLRHFPPGYLMRLAAYAGPPRFSNREVNRLTFETTLISQEADNGLRVMVSIEQREGRNPEAGGYFVKAIRTLQAIPPTHTPECESAPFTPTAS